MLGLCSLAPIRPIIFLASGLLLLTACNHEGELQLSGQSTDQAPAQTADQASKTEANKEARATPEAASDRFTGPANRSSAVAQKYMVAAANPLAARAGLEILRAGGSAVDAVIATQLALNVVEPQSSGIGGGAFLMHYQAKSRAIEAYDGRETAPAAASGDMFLKEDGSRPNFHDVVPGGLSVGVPGALRMMELAHQKHGRLAWAKLFEPAIKLADEGFKISKRLNTLVKIDRHLKKFSLSKAFFYDNAGFAKPIGTLLINKPLAETFRQIAEGGADAFYKGEIATDIVKTVRAAALNPGRMTTSDLAGYQAKKRSPVCSFYRVWLICGMPPPTSGGVTTLQILGLLQGTDLSRLIPGSAEAVHMIAEAGRLAFADRNKYLADDDFVAVPKDRLIDPGYLAKRAKLISKTKSMGKAKPGKVKLKTAQLLGTYAAHEGESTSHISVVDDSGNAVSMTSSIENAFGSRLMVRGFLLNNQLTDFSFVPVVNGKAIANRVQPKKRPRSSMSPTLVVDGSGKLVMAVGSPGGSRIIGYVAKTLIAALDWKMGIQAAIELPHFVNRNGSTDLEKGSNLEVLKPALEKLGHKVRIRKLTSGLHGIFKAKDGKLYGGADPRREGVALGD
ncbi:MAG: gamma-glutamyltransferase [Rhodospirillaceae bacterium]|jgi:gamma-glutamyltranspeptidase / glutathione hydrolase|nr:gamma-glutamyltransferase [Rhodospirillaceae bacterium]MBT7955500.1 gamma-glutamyltransferase [Rhodospirillaceae bacterium]